MATLRETASRITQNLSLTGQRSPVRPRMRVVLRVMLRGRVELPTGQRSSLVLPQHPGFQVGFQQRHVPRLLLANDIDERGEEQARQAMRPGIEPRPKPCACRFLRQRHGQGDRDRAAVDPGPPVRPVVLGAFLLYQSGKAKGSFRCLTRIFSSYRRTSAGRYRPEKPRSTGCPSLR